MELGVLARLAVRRDLLRKGFSRTKINHAIDAIDEPMLLMAAKLAKVNPPVEEDPTPTPDPAPQKTLWERLKAWLASPEGKAFIQMIISLIMTLLVAA